MGGAIIPLRHRRPSLFPPLHAADGPGENGVTVSKDRRHGPVTSVPSTPARGVFWGLALVAGATLMLEIVLTRIFSVLMWYHMSLVSVSMAMCGMTLGAIVVHRFPERFGAERAPRVCAILGSLFAMSVVGSLLVCLATPFRVDATAPGVFLVLYWNAVAALPFLASGIVISTVLTRFPGRVGALYAADLAGAALGCLAVVACLSRVDAISATFAAATVAAAGSVAFAASTRSRALRLGTAALFLSLAALTVVNAKAHLFRIQYSLDRYVGGEPLRREYWNAFSYVTVHPPDSKAFYWGPGDNASREPAENMLIRMDTRAATPMVRFRGDWDAVSWLLADATSLVHHLRPDGPVLVIGSGGGRDVLAALAPSRGHRSVTGVDINPRMVSIVTKDEAEFGGHLADLPGVRFVTAEGRSWLARSREKFEVITVPLVDTSAASAAGAYALTENSLYTVEAFRLFIRRLTPTGVLSVSRWWWDGQLGETHRLVGLAAAALRAEGVEDPSLRLVVARGGRLATLLVSAVPFTAPDIALLTRASEKAGFEVLLAPGLPGDSGLAAAASDPAWSERLEAGSVNLSPPTDDRPFFFHSFRMTNLLRSSAWSSQRQAGVAVWDKQAMTVLGALLIAVTALAFIILASPFLLELRSGFGSFLGRAPYYGYFAAIGLGFLLVESAQIVRLSIFLGYPIYALTVVLFTLLLSSSAGAFLTGALRDRPAAISAPKIALVLLAVLAATGLATRPLLQAFAGADTPLRVAVAALLVGPAGVVMGTLFPLGLASAARRSGISLPLAWAVNGTFSTAAGIYAVAISISAGIAATFWAGGAAYVVAMLCLARMLRADRA